MSSPTSNFLSLVMQPFSFWDLIVQDLSCWQIVTTSTVGRSTFRRKRRRLSEQRRETRQSLEGIRRGRMDSLGTWGRRLRQGTGSFRRTVWQMAGKESRLQVSTWIAMSPLLFFGEFLHTIPEVYFQVSFQNM